MIRQLLLKESTWRFKMLRVISAALLAALTVSSIEAYDLSQVKNLSSFYLPAPAKEKLRENGFVVLSTGHDDIYDIYIKAKERGKPLAVTSDLLLHTAHVLFDYTLRIVEKRELIRELTALSEGMLRESIRQLQAAREPRLVEVAQMNASFFGVGAKLLGLEVHLPAEIKRNVDKEVDLIGAHAGISPSPIFGYLEDYSQYVPRGHYTRNEDFRRFFKAMIWYGRMGFYLRPGEFMYPGGVDIEEEGRKLTVGALLMVSTLRDSEELSRSWKAIYEPTSFFVGKMDDLDLYDYAGLSEEIWGERIPQQALAKNQPLDTFIERASNFRKPRILSTPITDMDIRREGAVPPTQGFRFIGQRYIPDSYIMQNLVYDRVVNYTGKAKPFTMESSARGPQRCFPRGLDVMAALGSDLAEEVIYAEGDGDYENYGEQLSKLKGEFSSLSEDTWRSNLYFIWLSALRSLLEREDKGYPRLMKSNSWRRKELNAALGSWAELRHDTILYAKQSYTVGITSLPPRPKLTRGWVEPYPRLYARIGILLGDMLKTLKESGLLLNELADKLTQFRHLCNSLETISSKELKREALTDDEYELIRNIGSITKSYTRFSPQLMDEITTGTDEKMAIVADVHTDPNTKKVLEEGVGNPGIIYLICSIDNEQILTEGGVFTYYEFKHPMEDRLTDEKWQEMVKGGDGPELPEWVEPLYP